MSQQVPRMSSLFKLEYPQSVGVYGSYDEAQHVVDYLADSRFPVENLCIVGTELRSIERVLGRRSWGNVIGAGTQSGISTGLMITLLMWIFIPDANFILLALYALAVGITVGVVFAVFGYWMSQGKRDFRSVSQTMATKYEVLAEHKVAGQARELIANMPGARAAQFAPVQAPTAYPPQGYPAQPPAGYPQGGYPYPSQAYQPAPGYPPVGQQPPSPGAPDGLGQPRPSTPPPPMQPPAPQTPEEPKQDGPTPA